MKITAMSTAAAQRPLPQAKSWERHLASYSRVIESLLSIRLSEPASRTVDGNSPAAPEWNLGRLGS